MTVDEKFYDNYFPEYDEINLDIDQLINGLVNDLKTNTPNENNS